MRRIGRYPVMVAAWRWWSAWGGGGALARLGGRGWTRCLRHRGPHAERHARRRGDLPDPGPGELELHPVPVQPRLRDAGVAEPGDDVGDPITGAWLLGHGYALAGSSYASTGWAIQQALPDQISTLNVFDEQVGTPARTIAWGHSLGGIITAGLIQDYPNRFSAALPMCGVLSGGVATWNTALDAEFAFQQLIDPSVQVVNITDPTANLSCGRAGRHHGAADRAGPGPARARRRARRHAGLVHPAVARAGRDRLRGAGEQPVPVGHRGRLPVRVRAAGRARGPGGRQPVLEHRRELLRPAGQVGRPPRGHRAVPGRGPEPGARTWPRSTRATRISADPAAVRYLAKNIAFNGQLPVPVLTMHTTGDGLVVPENEQAYAERRGPGGRLAAAAAGLRQPGRALRVHPGGDHRRGPGAAAAGSPPGNGTTRRCSPRA